MRPPTTATHHPRDGMMTVVGVASGIENPESHLGCYACTPDDYDRFKPFFARAIAKCHAVSSDHAVQVPPPNQCSVLLGGAPDG
jgi:hypothetical protein